MERKRIQTIFIRTAVIIAVVAAVLFLFEIYLRLSQTQVTRPGSPGILPLAESDAELLVIYTRRGRRLVPGARVLVRNHRISGRDIFMEINSHGFRDKEMGASRKENELRILVLGDSITWASYLQAEEVYVERAEEYLRRSLPERHIEVINAGVGDIGLKEEIAILREQGLSLKPDIVLVAFYLNDSRPPWGFPGELGHRGWLRRHSLLAETIYKNLKLRRWVKEQGEERLAWTTAMDDGAWIDDRQAFLQLAALARYDWGAAWEVESWGVIEREFAELSELSREHDFTVAVVAFPAAFQVYATFLEDTPQRLLRQKAKLLGFHYLDLLPLLREYRKEEGDIFYDWCHPTVKTNDFIGREVAIFLKGILEAEAPISPASFPSK